MASRRVSALAQIMRSWLSDSGPGGDPARIARCDANLRTVLANGLPSANHDTHRNEQLTLGVLRTQRSVVGSWRWGYVQLMSTIPLSTVVFVASTCVVATPLLACDVAEHGEFAGNNDVEQIEDDAPFLDELGAPKPGPHAALNGCYWEYKETTSSNEIRTDPCPLLGLEFQTFPVSGGCHTDSDESLKVSIPLEFNGSGIDDDESVTNGYRWLCRFSGTPGSGNAHRAWALCCIP